MFYYFYSEKQGLKGLINHRLVKDSLFESREKAVEAAIEKYAQSDKKPVLYIYKCRQMGGQYFNNAYKTEHPVEIMGCEKMEESV